MKKRNILYVLLSLTLVASLAFGKGLVIDPAKLPAKVKTFVKTHFSNTSITYADQDRDKYEVTLANGVEIDFLLNGDWKEIDGNYTDVPMSVLPPAVANAVKSQFPNIAIRQVGKQWSSYQIKLVNKMDLVIDETGKILRQKYDD